MTGPSSTSAMGTKRFASSSAPPTSLEQKHRHQEVRGGQRAQVLHCQPGRGGGWGMKWRNPFSPKTRNIRPSRLRAISVAIFIVILS